jgi:PhzF family phenazine biosynthesis protein
MRIWFVDSFADRVFVGATAAVVPLEAWHSDELLLSIAAENRTAETAFFVPTGLKGNYQLRWFTPAAEVTLCGHATLAAGAILLTEIERDLDVVVFDSQAGPLVVRETQEGFTLDMPRRVRTPWQPGEELIAGLGANLRVVDGFVGEFANIVLESETAVRSLRPDLRAVERLVRGPRVGCLTVTARADEGKPYDYVCRFFAPGAGVAEEPATGSALADLTPYWCDRLDRDSVTGFQASRRGGLARGLQTLSSTRLLGQVAVYLRGELDPAVTRLGGGRPLRARPIVDNSTPVAPVIPMATVASGATGRIVARFEVVVPLGEPPIEAAPIRGLELVVDADAVAVDAPANDAVQPETPTTEEAKAPAAAPLWAAGGGDL